MAVINFVKGEQYYTAEFQINGPVNVHIERAEAGALYFRQRSIDHGSYYLINGANWNNRGDLTIDTAIQGVVYPMWIKIESASEPTLAEMVEGEQSGGGAGTESTIEYLDLSGIDESKILGFVSFGILAKIPNAGIVPPTLFALEAQVSDLRSTTAIAVDYGIEFIMGGMNMNVESLANNMGLDITSVPRLTKEQFYSLEA